MHARYRQMIQRMKDDDGTEWSVYILRCGDGTFYTGVTKDVQARLATHNAGRGGAYTRTHLPVVLLYAEPGYSRASALRREAAIKQMSRPKKEKLIGTSAH